MELQDPARVVRLATVFMFSGEEFRRLPMESDSVALEPVSSTQLKLALSAISAKKKENILIEAFKMVNR